MNRRRLLLDRKEAMKEARQAMGPAYELLHVELKYGLALLQEIFEAVPFSYVADTGLRLLRNYLACVDAADTLLRSGAAGPTQAVTRSALDVALQLLYVLKMDDERIAAAFVAAWFRDRFNFAERFAGLEGRKRLEEQVAQTHLLSPGFADTLPDAQPALDRLRALRLPPLIGSALEELRGLKSRKAPWYQAYGGPSDARQLAERVEFASLYDLLYAPYSEEVHGTDPTLLIERGDRGDTLRPLRGVEDWETVTTWLHTLTVHVLRTVATRFLGQAGQQRFDAWYVAAVRPILAKSKLRVLLEKP